ncbi:helix-turn-helix transcriptional regulator [Brucepastera parasyntrophica]|uniref:helix-turn-helix domain-containing protein n=1 Tax=Brucepastera parasyntrophica TaxID=2880008 RepID=UPI00210ACCB5|nr:helix-turn-helix transcriptional regulator [Brucepastera parasyntrophica]ULQ60688.1 helix-turn-helix transcriptional regulator [Brucepastera parasyntrophica]
MTEVEIRGILSSNLKKYRNYRKFSQAELAEKLDISIPFLSDVENGRKWISPLTLVKLASALDIEPYELFKPENAVSPEITTALTNWSNDIVEAVTQTVKNIQTCYLTQGNVPPEN